jgi:hypothetical protein
VLLFFLFWQNAVGAADVYALFNYSEKSDVYRVFSTNNTSKVLGKVFSAYPADDFYIDEQRHLRLVYTSRKAAFSTSRRSLYRQVFDGLPALADIGAAGYGQHQDQRDVLIFGHSGRPVFRSRGAPFSPGSGFMVSQAVARQGLLKGETDILPDKNWYEIPNSSWYQTWFASADSRHLSYMIFYDCWEQREVLVNDAELRGFSGEKADDRLVGKTLDYRLRRARIDGAMELIADAHTPAVVLNLPAGVAFCRNHSSNNPSGSAIYSWYDDAPGTVSATDWTPAAYKIVESRQQKRRFPVLLADKRLLVMGTDVLHVWLNASGLPHVGSECTFCVTVPVSEMKYATFVYSAPNNSLYRFYINNDNTVDYARTAKSAPDFVPAAMTGDNDGNLLLGSFSTQPAEMSENEDLLPFVEAIDFLPSSADEKTIRGTMLLTQQFYYNVYLSAPDSIEPLWQDRINVGRHFYQCEFSIAAQSQKLTGDVREILDLTRKEGNYLSKPVRLDESRQPGQFIVPGQVFMALTR